MFKTVYYISIVIMGEIDLDAKKAMAKFNSELKSVIKNSTFYYDTTDGYWKHIDVNMKIGNYI